MIVSLIVAASTNNVIGQKNQLPWHLPADLIYFKKLTLGHPIVMGRKTHESIGKPLPDRTNVVITQNKKFEAPGCLVFHSLEEALQHLANEKEIFLIGGAQLFQQGLERKIIDKLYLTRIHRSFEGDIFLPTINWQEWILVNKEDHTTDEKNVYAYSFETYTFKK